MRERRSRFILTVLFATVAAGALPVTAAAQSGLPPTISLRPEAPAPGSVVDVSGLDFPPSAAVQLHLITVDRIIPLGSVEVSDSGTLATRLTLPSDIEPGVWQIRASGPEDAVAVRLFSASREQPAVGAVAAEGAAPRAATSPVRPDEGGSDVIVLLILLGLLAAIVGAAVVAWRIVSRGDRQPGMPAGDDPIWTVHPPRTSA